VHCRDKGNRKAYIKAGRRKITFWKKGGKRTGCSLGASTKKNMEGAKEGQ